MNSRPSRSVQSEHLPDPWSQFITNQIDMKEGNQDNVSTSSKSSSLEIGQEAEEIKNVQNYHPLSLVNEDPLVSKIIFIRCALNCYLRKILYIV